MIVNLISVLVVSVRGGPVIRGVNGMVIVMQGNFVTLLGYVNLRGLLRRVVVMT